MSTWYQSIADLPLRNFIEVSVKGNLHALTTAGNPSIDQLSAAWGEISQQYSDAIGDNEHRMYTILVKDLALLNATFQQIQIGLQILSLAYSKDIAGEINRLLSTTFSFDPSNKEQYLKDIKRANNRSKALKIQIDLKEASVEAMRKKTEGKGSKPTVEYFQRILITLSNHAKYHIGDDITTYSFCERLKQFNSYAEQMSKHGSK